jgi:two-component system, NarL family, nitrate/nitrite response regulator NarL
MKKIRLEVVDDHALFRRGLVSLLSDMQEFKVAAEAGNGAEALEALDGAQPDIVLMDVNMPVMNGVEALTAIRKKAPGQKVVMLTISQNDADLLGAILAGANGYILKNAEPDVLRSTLLQVMDGLSVLSPEITGKVLEALRHTSQNQGQMLLSSREVEVLGLMAKGQTTRQIAEALVISENTVKTHIRHILEKLEVNNRAKAVSKAVEMRYILP